MSNAALQTVQVLMKMFYYVFKALWQGLTFGFRAYQNSKNKKTKKQ